MLDKNYIEEIKNLDKKESKAKLDEYAQMFGIKLKKTKSFENMLSDLEIELKNLSNEPMPEKNEGLTISDLIQADDELSGNAIFKNESKEEALQLLIDEPVKENITAKEIEKFLPKQDNSLTIFNDDKVIKIEDLNQDTFNEAMDKIVTITDDSNREFKLPDNFSPNLTIIGKLPGYVTLPWWIYSWIKDNPEWKSNPTSFEHPSAHQTLFSLIYYINRYGSIRVRETRNSRFDILT